jgi:hypothetical protein
MVTANIRPPSFNLGLNIGDNSTASHAMDIKILTSTHLLRPGDHLSNIYKISSYLTEKAASQEEQLVNI